MIPEYAQKKVDLTITTVRGLLAVDRAAGRAFLAALHVTPSLMLDDRRRLSRSYERDREVECLEASLAAYEAEQRATGFGTGRDELLAAEAAVVPVDVEIWPTTDHGRTIAGTHERTSTAYYHTRAEHRDDSRWKGAYVEVAIEAHGVHMAFGRRVEGKSAHEEARLFVGRWTAIAKALLGLTPKTQLDLFEDVTA